MGRINSRVGHRDSTSRDSVERWLASSYSWIRSISSPKNSIRHGASAWGAKTSRIPPRRENSPFSVTVVDGRYPSLMSCSVSWWGESMSPGFRETVASRQAWGLGRRMASARGVVITLCGPGSHSFASTACRACSSSSSGETPS
ncbi:hypothetical protein D3C86_1064110 [compost metagenome]